jgi:hypothetical protein
MWPGPPVEAIEDVREILGRNANPCVSNSRQAQPALPARVMYTLHNAQEIAARNTELSGWRVTQPCLAHKLTHVLRSPYDPLKFGATHQERHREEDEQRAFWSGTLSETQEALAELRATGESAAHIDRRAGS